MTFAQDNPDVINLDKAFDEATRMVYYFRPQMLFTDATFAGSLREVNLYIGSIDIPDQVFGSSTPFDTPKIPYNPDSDGTESHYTLTAGLMVTHITAETFQSYSEMAAQLKGMGFFAEPTYISTNMEHGVGSFSVQHSTCVTCLKKECWGYSRIF